MDAIPVMVPQSHREYLQLELVAMITHNPLAMLCADAFTARLFLPNEIAEEAVYALNRAMREVRYLERV